MSGGYIHGGWGFVWSAYGLTAGLLLIYGISLVHRYRAERRRFAATAGPDNR
jgi:heme exporter protein D